MLDKTTIKLFGKMEQSINRTEGPKKGLLQTEELYEYILETSVYPREPAPLKELRHVTASHPRCAMATVPDAGQLMTMFLKLVNTKKTIEIGVYTGYSLLLTALTIPDDGEIVAIDVNRKAYEIGLQIIKELALNTKSISLSLQVYRYLINFCKIKKMKGLLILLMLTWTRITT